MLFLGVLFFIFVIFAQPQELNTPLYGQPVVAVSMGFVAIMMVLQNGLNRDRPFPKTQQNALMFWLWFWVVFSTYQVHWLPYTKEIFLDWAKIMVIYWALIRVVNTPQRLRTVIWTIVLSFSVTAYIGIMQYYGVDYTGRGIGHEGRIRGIGIFDTNQLAYTLGFVGALAFGLFASTKNLFAKALLVGTIVMFYYGIYFTNSRGGLLCGVAVLGLTFLLFQRNKALKVIGLVMSGGLLLLFIKLSHRLQAVGDYRMDASSMGRLNVWGAALMNLKLFPLGIGKGQFKEWFRIAPHSSYIEAVSELGVFGLYVWLALFYYSLKNLEHLQQEFPDDTPEHRQVRFLAKSFQVSLLAYLFGSFFSGNTYYWTLFILFALIVVMQNVYRSATVAERRLFLLNDLRNIAAAEVGILLAIHLLN